MHGRNKKVVVHPPSKRLVLGYLNRQLQPGGPTAHERSRLPLLPPGPDGVWRSHVAQDLTVNTAYSNTNNTRSILRMGIQPRCSGLRVTGHR